jgi:redox-sensitive bicupin YhaK (pirin superfamily)
MNVIHFTQGATDQLKGFSASAARFVPLADGTGDTHISCLHLEKGANVNAPSISHGATLLVVHGRITITTHIDARIQFAGGMGVVFTDHEPYTIESDAGAIVLIVEATDLKPHARGISTPQRIAGQTWPSDSLLTTPGSS